MQLTPFMNHDRAQHNSSMPIFFRIAWWLFGGRYPRKNAFSTSVYHNYRSWEATTASNDAKFRAGVVFLSNLFIETAAPIFQGTDAAQMAHNYRKISKNHLKNCNVRLKSRDKNCHSFVEKHGGAASRCRVRPFSLV